MKIKKNCIISIFLLFILICNITTNVYGEKSNNIDIDLKVENKVNKEKIYEIYEDDKYVDINIIATDLNSSKNEPLNYQMNIEYDLDKIEKFDVEGKNKWDVKIKDDNSETIIGTGINTENEQISANLKFYLKDNIKLGDRIKITFDNININNEKEEINKEKKTILFEVTKKEENKMQVEEEKNEEVEENETKEDTKEIKEYTKSVKKKALTTKNENKQPLKDGVYTIQTKLNTKMVLDVSAASLNNGGNIQIWQDVNVNQQKFIINYIEDGWYKIVSYNSGKVLDVEGGASNLGTNVQQYEWNNSDAQKWKIEDLGNGEYSIISKCNGLYLDVSNASTNNGTNIQVYTSNGCDAQKFKVRLSPDFTGKRTIEDGTYTIMTCLDKGKVIDVSEASRNNSANIQIWSNVWENQQKFIVKYLYNGFYKITSYNSEKVLDVQWGSKESGANVQQYDSNNTDAQMWTIKDLGNGEYAIISKCNGLYLDVSYANTYNGTNIQVYEGNQTTAQKFTFLKDDLRSGDYSIGNGVYSIASTINNNYVLDISEASIGNSANLQLWWNVNAKQQKYLIEYIDNGFYRIRNVNSNKVLDVAGGATNNGANVWQWEWNGTDAQKWIIKKVGEEYSIIAKASGKCLDVFWGNVYNGSNIQIYESNNTQAQKFKINVTEFKGIDVSKYQKNTNWQAVKNSGVDFTMIRVGFRGYGTEGTLNLDPLFNQNINGALSNGIDCGIYFFSQAVNYNEGVQEAKWTLEQIKGYNITYPIAIDTEESSAPDKIGRADNISKEDRTAAIRGFCETIMNAGYKPMIYASKYWLKDKLNMSDLQGYDVWLAHYVSGAPNNKSDYDGPYTMWQYTSSGYVNGINGEVDMNICYKKY